MTIPEILQRLRRSGQLTEPYRWAALAAYNGRVAQGIVHTPEYVARMRDEQAAFHAEQRAEFIRGGYIEHGDGLWVGPAR